MQLFGLLYTVKDKIKFNKYPFTLEHSIQIEEVRLRRIRVEASGTPTGNRADDWTKTYRPGSCLK